ncbi:MAG: hypothetical protein ABR517_11395 [Thermoanaerobaculia bacterium]
MKIVTLDTLPLETVIATFNEAFADYAVPISLDRERFLNSDAVTSAFLMALGATRTLPQFEMVRHT